jgi:hypothetical protein
MKYYVMQFLWMSVIYYWEGHGNMTGNLFMMGERILIPYKIMVGHICCYQ